MRCTDPLVWLSKEVPQFVFGILESISLSLRELIPRPIDVERQHRHRRAERIGLAASTALSRVFKGFSYPPRVIVREHAWLEIESIATLGYMLRPPFHLSRSHSGVNLHAAQ